MKKLVVILLALGSYGCGKQDGAPTSIGDMTGTWVSACTNIGTQTTLIISGNQGISQIDSYDGNTCTGTPGFTINGNASYSIGDPASGISGAYKVNTTNLKATITIKTNTDLTIFNSQSLCGKSNWALNSETDISGKNCGTVLGAYSVGTIGYDLIQMGAVGAQSALYFGDKSGTNNGTSEALRPTTLLTQQAFIKN